MASTFRIGPRSKEPKDSGLGFKIMVRLCGAIALGGFFLPYLDKLSGLEFVTGLIDVIGELGFGESMELIFKSNSTGGTILKVMILLAYFLFPFLGLLMLIRGKYAGGPFTLLLLYNIALIIMVNVFGSDAGIDGNFFSLTMFGYWVSIGALFLPFLGMFFLDKSI